MQTPALTEGTTRIGPGLPSLEASPHNEGPPVGGPSSARGRWLRGRRLRYRAELDEHSQGVHQLPFLGDLPVREP